MVRSFTFRIVAAGSLSVLAASTAASAADLSDRPSLLAAAPIVPPAWSGFYVGIQGGYARAGKQTLHTVGVAPRDQAIIDFGGFGQIGFSKSGFAVGGTAGYDYQFAALPGFVLGAQADLLYTSLDRQRSTTFWPPGQTFTVNARQGLDYLGLVRGRLGYALDRALIYGTGGFAYGSTSFTAQTTVITPIYSGVADGGSLRDIQTGFVYGGGVEFKLPTSGAFSFLGSDNLSVKVEYLRYDLGRRSLPVNGKGPVFGPGGIMDMGQSATTTFRTQGQIVSAGINYRF